MKADRFDIDEVQPGRYAPLLALDAQFKESTITHQEKLLIYIRASQLNGCAFCIQSHIKEAIDHGEQAHRIYALPYWKESPFFTPDEALLLSITEEVTHIAKDGLSENVYQEAVTRFGQKKVADIIMAVTCINAWNRIGRATLLTPEPAI